MRALRESESVAELEVARAISSLKSPLQGEGDAPDGGATLEPRKKRPLSGPLTSPLLKKQALAAMAEDRKVDPAVLQFQNQKLSQQLDVQKERIQDLEAKLQGVEQKQASYDANLITINRIWGQLIDDLNILAAKTSSPLNGSTKAPSLTDDQQEDATTPTGDLFLNRLLLACPKVELDDDSGTQELLERALEARSAQTVKVLKCIVGGIEQQRRRNEDLVNCAKQSVSDQEVLRAVEANEAALREEVGRTREAIDDLHTRHRALLSEVSLLRDVRVKQQAEIRALSEQLEDSQSELEGSRRRLSSLKQQHQQQLAQLQQHKQGGACVPGGACSHGGPTQSGARAESANGEVVDASVEELKRLRASLDEAKDLASLRLKEIGAKEQEHLEVLRKLRAAEAALGEEQHIQGTRPYQALAEQLADSRKEAERLRAAIETLQKERNAWTVREREMSMRADAGDTARRSYVLADTRVRELEAKLRLCLDERNRLQERVQVLQSVASRSKTVEELNGILSSVKKGQSVLQEQLDKYKKMAEGMPAVRAENKLLRRALLRKSRECEGVKERCEASGELLKQQEGQIKELRGLETELRLFVDMYARESLERREVREVKESEARALAQVARLRGELDEHSLALRVRAANEAEAACQQRLMAAEAEVTRLREQMVDSERKMLELEEQLTARAEEGEVYVTEIETIGQAYEDMQSQNRRLLQQLSERDEYSTQLMAESVKAKQLQASLEAEKADMEAKMNSVGAQAAIDRQRVQQLEDQMRQSREQLEKVLEESRRAATEAEAARRQQAEAEKESATLKRAALEGEREIGQKEKRVVEAEESLEKERHKLRRLEEEKAVLARKLARVEGMGRESSSMSLELGTMQEELNEYKSQLKCSVCHDRRKEVTITKCFHVFCSPCIQRNLELRHRKCPGCGVPFGQGDVKTIYL